METATPILEYGRPPGHGRLRWWANRGLLAGLAVAVAYASLLGWLYWGWLREQAAMDAMPSMSVMATPIDSGFLSWVLPDRLDWVRDRVTLARRFGSADDEDFGQIRHFTYLESLILEGHATDEELVHLRGLKTLKALNLSDTKVSDTGLAELTGLVRLDSLNLKGTDVTDSGLAHLGTLAELYRLDLSRTSVTDAGLVHLQRLPGLGLLDLDETQITDAGLVHLERLPRLKMLGLSGTGITDVGLKHLEKLTELKGVGLDGTRVTREGMEALHEALPRCIVFTDAWSERSEEGE